MGDLIMPQIFKVFGYTIYFWSNENLPLEPIHVHISKGTPTSSATKVWITKKGNCLLCNNNSNIPKNDLYKVIEVLEARSFEIMCK